MASRLGLLVAKLRREQQELRDRLERGGEWLERVLIRGEGRVTVVPVEKIDHLEAARNNVRIHVGTATHLLRAPLGALETRLSRSHRREFESRLR